MKSSPPAPPKATEQAEAARKAEEEPAAQEASTGGSRWTLPGFGDDAPAAPTGAPAGAKPKPRTGYQRETIAEAAMKTVARTVASSLGRALVRGILGSLRR